MGGRQGTPENPAGLKDRREEGADGFTPAPPERRGSDEDESLGWAGGVKGALDTCGGSGPNSRANARQERRFFLKIVLACNDENILICGFCKHEQRFPGSTFYDLPSPPQATSWGRTFGKPNLLWNNVSSSRRGPGRVATWSYLSLHL